MAKERKDFQDLYTLVWLIINENHKSEQFQHFGVRLAVLVAVLRSSL